MSNVPDISPQDFSSIECIRDFVDGRMNQEQAATFRRLLDEDEMLREAVEGFRLIPAFDRVPPRIKVTDPVNRYLWVGGLGLAMVILFSTLFGHVQEDHVAMRAWDFQTANTLVEWVADGSGDLLGEINHREKCPRRDEVVSPSLNMINATIAEQVNVLRLRGESRAIRGNMGESFALRFPASGNDDFLVQGYRIHPYSGRADKDREKEPQADRHLPAEFEARSHVGTDVDGRSNNYLACVENIILSMRRGSLLVAREEWGILLQNYPHDVNALFYLGMIDYYRSEFESANFYFTAALYHPSGAFSDDACYYRAKVLCAQGQTETGCLMFASLGSKEGRYASLARSEMDRLCRPSNGFRFP